MHRAKQSVRTFFADKIWPRENSIGNIQEHFSG
jgi:hypothetical protein